MEDDDGGSRSLHSGISIPQWMKNKITETRLDFDEAAFSPPENDDSFFYIRYPQNIGRKLKSPVLSKNGPSITVEPIVSGSTDTNNHSEASRNYILKPEYYSGVTSNIKIKSNGIDNGFNGDDSACGSSVIRFAHQMVSGKYINPQPKASQDEPLNPALTEALLKRRGSKSLPASPLSTPQSSPKSKRRMGHKYFTGAFVDSENNSSGWLLQGLLSKREASHSINHLPEEDLNLEGDLVKAVSELHLDSNKQKPKKEFKSKPSEFREMNFWSPTSM